MGIRRRPRGAGEKKQQTQEPLTHRGSVEENFQRPEVRRRRRRASRSSNPRWFTGPDLATSCDRSRGSL